MIHHIPIFDFQGRNPQIVQQPSRARQQEWSGQSPMGLSLINFSLKTNQERFPKQLLNHQQRGNDGNYSVDEVDQEPPLQQNKTCIEADVRRQMREQKWWTQKSLKSRNLTNRAGAENFSSLAVLSPCCYYRLAWWAHKEAEVELAFF
jgi:hypothetical protein